MILPQDLLGIINTEMLGLQNSLNNSLISPEEQVEQYALGDAKIAQIGDYCPCPEPYPGIMKTVVDHMLEVAPVKQPELAIGGALSGMAANCDGSFALSDALGTRGNLYITGVADPSGGKDFYLKSAGALAKHFGQNHFSGIVKSDVAFEEMVLKPSLMGQATHYAVDELHAYFLAQKNSTNSYEKLIGAGILRAWSWGQQEQTDASFAKGRKQYSGRNPCLNIFGMMTSEGAKEVFSPQFCNTGDIPRFLVVRGRQDPQRTPVKLNLPPEEQRRTKLLPNLDGYKHLHVDLFAKTGRQSTALSEKEMKDAGFDPDNLSEIDKGRIAELEQEKEKTLHRNVLAKNLIMAHTGVEELLNALQTLYVAKYTHLKESNPVMALTYSRAYEKIVRICMVLARHDRPSRDETVRISQNHVAWAKQFVDYSNWVTLSILSSHTYVGEKELAGRLTANQRDNTPYLVNIVMRILIKQGAKLMDRPRSELKPWEESLVYEYKVRKRDISRALSGVMSALGLIQTLNEAVNNGDLQYLPVPVPSGGGQMELYVPQKFSPGAIDKLRVQYKEHGVCNF